MPAKIFFFIHMSFFQSAQHRQLVGAFNEFIGVLLEIQEDCSSNEELNTLDESFDLMVEDMNLMQKEGLEALRAPQD